MKLIKSRILFDCVGEKQNPLIGFDGDEIKYVGSRKPEEDRGSECHSTTRTEHTIVVIINFTSSTVFLTAFRLTTYHSR
jgi:hypothetical protein